MNARRAFKSLSLVCFAAGAVAAANAAPPVTAYGVTVTVHVFSGVPDPKFELADTAQLAELATMLREAPRQEALGRQTVLGSKLGYIGISVENPEQVAGLPARFAVYRGAIEVGTEGKEFFGDPGNRLASFLLEAAIDAKVIDPPLARQIKEKGLP